MLLKTVAVRETVQPCPDFPPKPTHPDLSLDIYGLKYKSLINRHKLNFLCRIRFTKANLHLQTLELCVTIIALKAQKLPEPNLSPQKYSCLVTLYWTLALKTVKHWLLIYRTNKVLPGLWSHVKTKLRWQMSSSRLKINEYTQNLSAYEWQDPAKNDWAAKSVVKSTTE